MAPRSEHTRAEELFSAYIDHRATADEQTFVERHVALCADCRAKLDATRAMVAALHQLPMVKAPRSFVLPREMERQARPSILTWYPVLRLATVVAMIALVIVFAGDVLIPRGAALNAMLPASAPAAAPQAVQAPAQPTAPAVAMQPTRPLAAAPQPAPEQSQSAAAGGATPSILPTATAPVAKAYDNTSPSLHITATSPVTVNIPIAMAGAPTIGATPEATPKALVAAPLSAAQSGPTARVGQAATPIDPLRAIEVALAGLVIVLVIATLIVRRRMTKT